MRRLLMAGALALVAALSLGGCDAMRIAQQPTGAQTVSDARNTIFTIKSGYGVTVRAATAYVKLPPCALPSSPPICANTAVVKQLAKAQIAASATINSAEEVILNAKGSSTLLSTAVDAAKSAYASFQEVVKVYNVGGTP